MAATSAGAVTLDLKANTSQFTNAAESAAGKLKSSFSNLGQKIAGVFAVAAVAKFVASCTELASNLNEVQNVVDVTFPNMSAKVDEWSKKAAESFGLSETMAKKYAGLYGSMAEAFGFAEGQAYDMATTLAGLAGDVASFYNIDQDLAYTKLKSVFSGETETLKDLGIVMTQNALDAYAMAQGWGKTTKEMTEAEKVSLRFAFVQSQLSNATGDFSRTSGSWANQTRLLKLRFDDLKTSMGQAFIAALLPAVKLLNSVIVGATNAFNTVNKLIEALTGKSMSELTGGTVSAANAIGDLGDAAEGASGSAGALGDAQDKTADATGKQAKAQKELNLQLASFDKITKLSAKAADDLTDAYNGNTASGGLLGGNVLGASGGLGAAFADETKKVNNALASIKVPESIKSALDRIKTAVSQLSDSISGGLKWAYDNVLVPLGRFTIDRILPDVLNLVADAVEHLNTWCRKIADPLGRFLELIRDGFMWAWENVLQPFGKWTINEAIPRVLDAIATAFDILVTVLEKLKPVAKFIWDEFLKPLADIIGGAIIGALDLFNDGLKGLLETVKKADFKPFLENVKTLKDWIGDKLTKAFEALSSAAKWLWDNVLKPFGDFLGGAFKKAVDGVKIVVNALAKAWEGVKSAAQWVYENVLKPIGDFFSGAFKKSTEAATKMVEGFSSVWGGIKDVTATLTAKAKDALGAAGRAIGDFWGKVKTTTATLTGAAKDALGAAGSALQTFWAQVKSGTRTLTGKAVDSLGKIGDTLKSFWATIKTDTRTLTGKAADALGSVGEKLKTFWSTVKTNTSTLTGKAADALGAAGKAIGDFWNKVTNKTSTLTGKAEDKTGTTVKELQEKFASLKDKTARLTAENKVQKTVVDAALNILKPFTDVVAKLTAKDSVEEKTVISAKTKLDKFQSKEAELTAADKAAGGVTSANKTLSGYTGKSVNLTANDQTSPGVNYANSTIRNNYVNGEAKGYKRSVELTTTSKTAAGIDEANNNIKEWYVNGTSKGWKRDTLLTATNSTKSGIDASNKNISEWYTNGSAKGWKRDVSLTASNGTTDGVNAANKNISEWFTNGANKGWSRSVSLTASNATTAGIDASNNNINSYFTNGSAKGWKRSVNLTANNSTTAGVNDANNNINNYFTNGASRGWARTVNLTASNATTAGINAANKMINDYFTNVQRGSAKLYVEPVITKKNITLNANTGGGWYIQAYAQGGWVERNQPRLAIIGDNTREGEIVSPESKFQTMLNKAAALTPQSSRTDELLIELIKAVKEQPDIYLDGKAITRSVVGYVNGQTKATGKSPIIV